MLIIAYIYILSPWSYKLRKKVTPAIRKRVRKNKAKGKGLAKTYVDGKGRKRVCSPYIESY